MNKITLLLLVSILSITNLYSQNCKSNVSVKDKKTNVLIEKYGDALGSARLYNGSEYQPYIFLRNINNVNYVEIIIKFTFELTYNEQIQQKWFTKGCAFDLYFSDGDKLLFETIQTGITRTKSSHNSIALLYANLTEKDLELLSSKIIESYIIHPFINDDQTVFGTDLKKKKAIKLQKQFRCFKSKGFTNEGKVKNLKKASTLAKLGNKKFESGDYERALYYFEKSLKESENSSIIIGKCLTLVMLNRSNQKNKETFITELDKINKNKGKSKYFSDLENWILELMDKQPKNEKLEAFLTILTEY